MQMAQLTDKAGVPVSLVKVTHKKVIFKLSEEKKSCYLYFWIGGCKNGTQSGALSSHIISIARSHFCGFSQPRQAGTSYSERAREGVGHRDFPHRKIKFIYLT